MPTPFEMKVLEDYAIALATSDVVNSELQAALLAAISGDKAPTADAILAIVKAHARDQSV